MKTEDENIEEEESSDTFFDDTDEYQLYDNCPRCGTAYDEIDYEYQICHYCHFNANTLQF